MESMRWLIQLVDGVTGPAKAVVGGLEGIQKQLEDLPFSQEKVRRGFDMLLEGAKELGRLVFEGGHFALEALAFKENALKSFELMLGTKEEAKDFFNYAAQFATQTPFETDEVIKSFQKIKAAGFSKAEVPVIFSALGDVTAMSGMDKQVMDRMTYAFAQLRNAAPSQLGHIFRELVVNGAQAGLSQDRIFTNLAKMLGVDKDTATLMVHHGKATTSQVMAAVLDTIQQTASGGGVLGSGIKAMSTSISGLLSTIKSRPMELFMAIDLDKSGGFAGIKKFLQLLADGLNPASEAGQKLLGTIDSILNSVGGWLSTFDISSVEKGFKLVAEVAEGAKQAVGAFVDAASPGMKAFGDSARGAGADASGIVPVLREIGTALGTIVSALGYIAAPFQYVGKAIGTVAGQLAANQDAIDTRWYQASLGIHQASAMANAGDAAGQGYVDSMLGWVPEVAAAGQGLALASVDGARVGLDAHSPSRVFEQLGAFAAAGFAQGVAGGTLGVDGAVARMVAPPGAGSRTVSGNQVHLTIQVQGGSDSADTIARRLSELLPTQLASLFEELAVEGGAA